MPKAIGGWRWKRGQRLGYVALILVLAHLATLGFTGWVHPEEWTSGIPPISLIAAVIAGIPLVVKYHRVIEREKRANPGD